ncbi:MAG: hypothetical protein ACT4OI_02440 [Methanobacteriota archaeon]
MIDRAVAAFDDPVRRARLVRWFWLLSTGFTLFGFAVIAYLLFVGR